MGWLLLSCGIVVNVSGVIIIKVSQQAGQPLLGLAGYTAYFVGFFIISLSFKYLEVSLAYALWSGVGSLLVLGCGVLLFKESLSVSKLLFFSLIMIGVVGLSFAPYLDIAGEGSLARLAHLLNGKIPKFGNYLIGFSVLSFLFLEKPSQVSSSQIEERSFITGSLVATLVMSLVLVLFLMLLQNGLSLLLALGTSAALWCTAMFMLIPGKQDA